MAGAAGIVAVEAIHRYSVEWLLLGFAGVLAAAGAGLTRRSLVAQVFSRGAAWLVFVPALLIAGSRLVSLRSVPLEVAGMAATTGLALLLARPMLHTKEAHEAFAPKAFRHWLLAGSIVNASAGFVAGAISLEMFRWDSPYWLANAALSLSLFASAAAVVRMRAWGVILGGLTSFVLLVTSLFANHGEASILALGATPSLLMYVLPILIARWKGTSTSSNVRVASDLELQSAFAPARYRVADEVDEIDVEPAVKTSRAASLRA
jgi:hypothetical protein